MHYDLCQQNITIDLKYKLLERSVTMMFSKIFPKTWFGYLMMPCGLYYPIVSGCGVSNSFYEADPPLSYDGSTVFISWEIRNRETILHSIIGRSRPFPRYPRKAGEGQPTWRSIQDQRKWSLPFLLKTSVFAQDFAWNSSNSLGYSYTRIIL